MDAELIDLARTVDLTVLGPRVRDARVHKGLTQTQVAGDEMSTGYVSRIESGKRRPDPELLEIIASRIGTSIDVLLMGTSRDKQAELRLALDWAEMSLKTGDAAGALSQVDGLLGELATASQTDLRRTALHIKATALHALGRLDDAIMVLEDLAESPTIDLISIKSLNTLSRCYRDAGDFTRAIAVGESALAEIRVRELDGGDEALSLTMVVASAYSERGDNGHAGRLIRRAITAAEGMGSPDAKAKAYWSASIMASRTGDSHSALDLARKALFLMESSEDQQSTARLRSQLGILVLRSDVPDPHEALLHLRLAEAELQFTDVSSVERAVNRLHQARAHFLLGDLRQAWTGASEAEAGAKDSSPTVAADASVLLGQIAMSEDDEAAANSHYRDAVVYLSTAGSDRGAAQIWFELGCLLEDVADTIGALDAYRRAGASTGLLPAPAPTRATACDASEISSLDQLLH